MGGDNKLLVRTDDFINCINIGLFEHEAAFG